MFSFSVVAPDVKSEVLVGILHHGCGMLPLSSTKAQSVFRVTTNVAIERGIRQDAGGYVFDLVGQRQIHDSVRLVWYWATGLSKLSRAVLYVHDACYDSDCAFVFRKTFPIWLGL